MVGFYSPRSSRHTEKAFQICSSPLFELFYVLLKELYVFIKLDKNFIKVEKRFFLVPWTCQSSGLWTYMNK